MCLSVQGFRKTQVSDGLGSIGVCWRMVQNIQETEKDETSMQEEWHKKSRWAQCIRGTKRLTKEYSGGARTHGKWVKELDASKGREVGGGRMLK